MAGPFIRAPGSRSAEAAADARVEQAAWQRAAAAITTSAERVIARYPMREASRSRTRAHAAVAAAVVLACLGPIVGGALGSIGLSAFVVAIAIALAMFAVSVVRRSSGALGGHVVIYGWGVAREDDSGSVRLVAFGEPFGVALLADHARSAALLAFTTPSHTRYVSIRASDAPRALTSRAITIAESDATAIRSHVTLDGADALALLTLLETYSPRSTERLFLTGSRGERISLDQDGLCIDPVKDTQSRGRQFDLRAPLEWRGFMFHESVGPVTTLYQATWVKQGNQEIVFVAPMPHVLASRGDRPGEQTGSDVARAVHDLKLLQSLPDSPPPRELRTAIERAFVLPLRQALDRAPRASRSAPPSRLSSSPGLV